LNCAFEDMVAVTRSVKRMILVFINMDFVNRQLLCKDRVK
jgi:hypothetical protein